VLDFQHIYLAHRRMHDWESVIVRAAPASKTRSHSQICALTNNREQEKLPPPGNALMRGAVAYFSWRADSSICKPRVRQATPGQAPHPAPTPAKQAHRSKPISGQQAILLLLWVLHSPSQTAPNVRTALCVPPFAYPLRSDPRKRLAHSLRLDTELDTRAMDIHHDPHAHRSGRHPTPAATAANWAPARH
jgi:hypothetical protein